ncbi:TetR/AcrR family transcriptional regulator [Actinomadura sp. ATCC 31491]|uniref:TetR/AcrR family transcriptional regulator n=1 Tax=Actinomadura luzonensis TaxID=2805427 RepID=A0ABT0G4Z8_9ACTN|nr:TetR/AcrR family transcriptional regulator [Actinomadura luzonensis]MCK2219255.1 TetR/AcrR family transcriptional regulator [Actinomadura luzonensis]
MTTRAPRPAGAPGDAGSAQDGAQDGARGRAGRPRSQEADLAILAAALDLLIEVGAEQTSIEQVARRAGVTRATVYRRYAGKTELLVRALEWANHDHDPSFTGWRDLGHMVGDWAAYLEEPRHRRLLRRLYAARDDYPALGAAYRAVNGGRRRAMVRATLARARDLGRLPAATDLDVVEEALTAAVLNHVGMHDDDESAAEIKAYFLALLRALGYDPAGTPEAPQGS